MKTIACNSRGTCQRAFTLIELLVVITVIAILLAVLMPALAGAQRRAKLAVCQSNFHQVSVASYVYANDYKDYFPICGSANVISVPTMASLVVGNQSFGAPSTLPNNPVKPGIQPGVFDNLGLLYATHGIGDGKVFYCPGFPSASLFSAASYSNPSFMSTDGDGLVQSTMLFNPQVAYPLGYFYSGTNSNPYTRLFQKTSNLIPGRLFGMDCLQTYTNGGIATQTTAYSANTFAHYPSKGFDVLFTDGSVQFVQSDPAFELLVYGEPVGAPGDGKNPPAVKYGLPDASQQYSWLYASLEGTPPTGIGWTGDGGN